MSNMTYFAERRRREMDAVLKKAGHTARRGEFETRPTGGRGGDAPIMRFWIWPKSKGHGHLSRINEILRERMAQER
jgi:hypothetical protein